MPRAGPSLFGLVAVCILARPFETGWVSAVPPLGLPWPGAKSIPVPCPEPGSHCSRVKLEAMVVTFPKQNGALQS